MGSPYKFNSNGAAEIFGVVSGQFVKKKKRNEQANKKDPNSLQNKANKFLNAAASEAAANRKRLAKNEAANAAAAAKAAANKRDRAAATRRKNAERNRQLIHVSNLEDLRTQKQVERAKALAEARNAGKPATPAAKPATPAAKPAAKKTAARRTSSGVSTDKDGVLKPVNPPKKPTAKARMALDTKAGDAYND
jgi:hypothetical protein